MNQKTICFVKIKEDDLELLMHWRMLPEITQYMNTDPILTLEGQKKWFQNISLRTNEFYWIVMVDGVKAGFISLVNPNETNKSIHTGVYIAQKEKRSLRLILDIQWNLYEYAFETLGLNKVCEEVFAVNKAVNRILDMCGSKREGLLRQHVYKNGIYYDVVTRGILNSEWKLLKPTLKYNKISIES